MGILKSTRIWSEYLILWIVTVILLSACGGGGGKDSIVATTTSVTTSSTSTTTTSSTSTTSTTVPEVCNLDVKAFEQKLYSGLCISYAPSGNWDPDRGIYPSRNNVRMDLEYLFGLGFDCISTYGSDDVLGEVPCLAKEIGFKTVSMGVWNPANTEEWDNALAAKKCADAYNVGNEGLTYPYPFGQSYTYDELIDAINKLRDETCRPVTTTEPLDAYFNGVAGRTAREIRLVGDWLSPNAHPYWEGITDPPLAVEWTVSKYRSLWALREGRFVFFKEVGLPTEGNAEADLSEENQYLYYKNLYRTAVRFSFFEAFDQKWKDWAPVEPHWGISKSDRTSKWTVDFLSEPRIHFTFVPAYGTYGYLEGKVVNVPVTNYRILVYIRVGSSWWVKPYLAWPLTTIKSDETWIVDVTTGGIDQKASEFIVYLVPPGYKASLHSGPKEGEYLTYIRVIR